ncbi:MAG: flagellar biosynthetic protein FliO [Limnochordia bacterium]
MTDDLNLMGEMLKILLVLILLIPLIYLATRLYVGQLRPGRGPGRLQVLEMFPLGTRRQLVLTKVGEQILLLGVTDHQITLLKEFSAEDFPQWPVRPQRSFRQIMEATWSQLKTGQEDDAQ